MKWLLLWLFALMMLTPAALSESSVRWIDGGDADRVHLRAAPSLEAESLGLYFTGTDAILIDQVGDWAWVMVGDEEGWMDAAYLTLDAPKLLGSWYVVDNPHSTWVNLRMSPSMDGMVIMELDNGTAVQLLGETADGWSYMLCDGVRGYIMTELLSPLEIPANTSRTTILAQTDYSSYIHQYVTDNGGAIYFVAMEREPVIETADVNFDGWADLVVYTVRGASNAFCEFFLYDAASDTYIQALHPGQDYGLCNYVLHPAYGLVQSHANNGSAGAEHETALYRWEGTELVCIREAVSEHLSEETFVGGILTTIVDTNWLRITVTDYEADEYEGTVIWEHVITLEDTAFRDIFNEETEALWQGVK